MTREQFYGIQYEEIFPYIEKLEQRIAELSAPKTCEGCRWFYGESQECMSYCSRGFEDKYEPKKDI